VTCEDIVRLTSLQEQTVVIIKAPQETKLHIPEPEEVNGSILSVILMILLLIFLFGADLKLIQIQSFHIFSRLVMD